MESLFEQLKKKGTLRGAATEKKKPKKILRTDAALTPTEIIAQAREKMTEKKPEKVPTAHELLEKKKKQKKS